MCEHCGCEGETHVTTTNLATGKVSILHPHAHQHAPHPSGAHAHSHGHQFAHAHGQGGHHHHEHHRHGDGQHQIVHLGADILAKNDALAAANRSWLTARRIVALNLMSAPGAGKTALLEATIRRLKDEMPIFVLEGDQATTNDSERIRRAGAHAVQINTGTGCHLDAHMVAHGLEDLDPVAGSLVFVENVGNLVCPALFDVGEQRRIVLLSVTEGDDKPHKYPHMFAKADLVLINKIDLLPYVDFNCDRAVAAIHDVNPDATVMRLSVRSDDGFDDWVRWLHHTVDVHCGDSNSAKP
jgi:hydrogenase nickel incorporation protein HypB